MKLKRWAPLIFINKETREYIRKGPVSFTRYYCKTIEAMLCDKLVPLWLYNIYLKLNGK